MYGLGVIVNGLVIVGASFAALILKKFIMKFDKNNKVEKISDTIMSGLALCIIYMGISGALECQHVLICIISMVVGGLIGELIDIDKGLNSLGDKIEEKLNKGKVDVSKEKVSISQGFVSASLLFCVGLFGNNDTLFAKSALDGVSSFLFSLTMGIGVLLSAVAVFLYEGIIACGAFLLKGVLSTAVITEMNAVGSLLILALGINMILKANIKVANLLPAMFVPIIFGIIGMI